MRVTGEGFGYSAGNARLYSHAWTQNPPWTDRDLHTVLHCAHLVSYIIGRHGI